ncbi:MAG: glycosyltransferase family 4 protein [Chloroflexota bacterium]|nr:glycosyltransferase family 4 protein [Chloroflexota bacterium]
MKRLRIALYHNLPSGGAMRSAYEMAHRLSERHAIDLYSLSTAAHEFLDLCSFVEESHIWPFSPGHLFGSPFGRLNQAVRLRDLARLERLGREIATAIDRKQYDVVFIHPCMFTQSPSLLSYLRTPSVYYCQESLRQIYEPPIPRPYNGDPGWRQILNRVDPLRWLYYKQLTRVDYRNARSAMLLLANSEFSRQSIRQAYGVDARTDYLGVDTDRFYPLGLQRGDWVFSAGALIPIKGFDFIVKALGTIAPELRPTLVIAANFEAAQERTYLQQLADEQGVSLDIRTPVQPDDMARLYNTACFTVYAPVREPLGLVPLESQACGTPVVGVREGGVAETVRDGETGLLTDRDPGAFGQAVVRLLQDTQERNRLGSAGPGNIAARWTWERHVRELEEYMVEAVQGSEMSNVVERRQ